MIKIFNHARFIGHFTAILLYFLMVSQSAFAGEMPDKACTNGAIPAFTDYAVKAQKDLVRPKLKLNNNFSRMFKTRLRKGMQENPVDFAGHYVIVTFGCGNGCLYGGYIDAETGQAMEIPFSVSPPGLFREPDPIEHKANSRLLIVRGNLNEADGPAMKYFFSLQGSKIKPICYAPLDTKIP